MKNALVDHWKALYQDKLHSFFEQRYDAVDFRHDRTSGTVAAEYGTCELSTAPVHYGLYVAIVVSSCVFFCSERSFDLESKKR